MFYSLFNSMRVRVASVCLVSMTLLLTACDPVYRGEGADAPARKITFSAQLSPSFAASYDAPARAAETPTWEDAIRRFMVFDGDSILADQVYTDKDFGSPARELAYGHHELRFVALEGERADVNYEAGVLTLSKGLRRIYYRSYPLDVNSATPEQLSIVLTRAYSDVFVKIDDAIPANVATFDMTFSQIHRSFSVVDSALLDPVSFNKKIDRKGSSFSTDFYLFAMSDFPTNLTISAKTSLGAVVAEHVVPITLRRNRVVNVHGNFFSAQSAPAVALQTLWADSVEYTY